MPAPEDKFAAVDDLLFPIGSTGGITDKYTLTEDNVKALLKARYIRDNPRITSPRDSIWSGLRTGIPLWLASLEKAAQGLLDRPDSVWDNLHDLVAALRDGVAHPITEHTEAIANLNDTASAMNTTVAYVGDLQDMVSAPRCLLAVTGLAARKCSDITDNYAIGGGALMKATVLPVIYPAIQPFVTTGDIIYAPIVVDRHGTTGKLRWIVGADTSIFSIDYYEIALCVYNPSNGNVEKVWGSGNIVSGVADTSTLTEVEVDMGLTQSVTPGQILFAAHQQVGPGLAQSPRAFAAVPQANIGRPSTLLLDAASYSLPAYSEGIPSSVSFASLTRENRFIPWAGVSVHAA